MEKEFKGGVILEPEKETDYVFLGGSIADRTIYLPSGDWTPYLPTDELQATKQFDPWSCLAESLTNVLETKLKVMMSKNPLITPILAKLEMLDSNGNPNISGRFLAKVSGTVAYKGNTQSKVLDAVRKYGLVGESVYPTLPDMSQEEYYKDVPAEVLEKAKLFNEYFDFGYERLPYSKNGLFVKYPDEETINEALPYSPLWGCVDGNYSYNADGTVGEIGKAISYNHSIEIYAIDHWVFDTYNPIRKHFVKDYKFGFVHSIHLSFKPMLKLYKKKGSPAIYVKLYDEDSLIAFCDGKITGGELFKSIYGMEYSLLPIEKVDVLPYPVKNIGITTENI